jgi:UDP-2,3-diacylglucosamine hydrolase
MAIYIFSDAHLGETDKEKEQLKRKKLNALLDLVDEEGEKLYILGDLFDFWFEYKYAIPKEHLRVVFRLASLVESGKEVHYITGNHDFWLGNFLNREAGIIIHRDFLTTVEQGKRIYMIHGDGISPSDRAYRLLKKILRNKASIWLYRKIPADWGIPLARRVAGISRAHTSRRTKMFLDDYEKFARGKISEGYDAVIIGHLHQPLIRKIDTSVYLNAGDFIEHFSYIRLDSGMFNLEYI